MEPGWSRSFMKPPVSCLHNNTRCLSDVAALKGIHSVHKWKCSTLTYHHSYCHYGFMREWVLWFVLRESDRGDAWCFWVWTPRAYYLCLSVHVSVFTSVEKEITLWNISSWFFINCIFNVLKLYCFFADSSNRVQLSHTLGSIDATKADKIVTKAPAHTVHLTDITWSDHQITRWRSKYRNVVVSKVQCQWSGRCAGLFILTN